MLSNNQQKKSIDAGHKFGHWTVLKKNRDETWLCQCRCGNKGDIPEAWLLSGFSKSCGRRRSRARDIRQRRFGRLTAIEPVAEKNTDGSIVNLFSLNYIEFYNDNVIRIPKNKSCELRLEADNEILNAQITIYPQYKAV